MHINFIDLFENDFLAFFPEIFLIFSTCFLLLYGILLSTSKIYNYPSLVQNVGWLSLLTLFYTLLLLTHNPIQQSLLFFNALIIDDFTFFFKVLLLGSAFSSILISLDYFKQEKLNAFEYIILILFAVASMLCMISSYDFITFYLSVELQSLCFYVLGASKRNSEFSTEAGLKYFILGAFSSGILLFGCSMIYGFSGITNFGDLAQLFIGVGHDSMIPLSLHLNGIILGILFVGVGFLFKLSAAPFHMWAPDVYEGSPTAITAFFSLTPKVALFAVFIRFLFSCVYDLIFPWQKVIILCSLLSMCVGALAALSQYKIKRLLAYSSIGHVGYLLIGISSATLEGIEALFIYLCIYILMTLNIFAVLLSLVSTGKTLRSENESFEKNGSNFSETNASNFSETNGRIFVTDRDLTIRLGTHYRIKYLSDLGMLSKTNPLLAFTLTCTLFSMAGIPPLAGFCSKFYIFFSALG
jgi:proton-translocating NADH-quinone oxidoreductase chain N